MTIEIEELKKTSLNLNDILLIKLSYIPSEAEHERICKNFSSVFPDNKIIVCDNNFNIEIIKEVDK